MTIRSFLLLLSICAAPASAQTTQIVDSAYHPGYASYGTPLVRFVRPELRGACDALARGDTQTALIAFQQETASHPDDMAAYVGLIQAMPRSVRESYLAQYQQDAKDHDDAPHQFKLGVLAWYLLGARLPIYDRKTEPEKKRLAQIVRTALPRAYDLGHAPVVGFSLADANMLVGKASLPVYEDMLKRVGGTAVYETYLHARDNGWTGQPPPAPDLPREKLFVISRIIANIWSITGGQVSSGTIHVVDGKAVTMLQTEPYSITQKRGLAFLIAWFRSLKSAATEIKS